MAATRTGRAAGRGVLEQRRAAWRAHWTGACPRPGESERIDFLDDLDDLLDEAERLLSVSQDALADAPLAGEVRSTARGSARRRTRSRTAAFSRCRSRFVAMPVAT